ncbi:galactokinase [Altererythrobacter sp. ZODW24]|uniref:galactokinase n=1 Tax=Altererythrobacter sp. ZODW24 TaxID=2185142 RepID=UPI000DF744B7|nr:galactokinase [Altererythrobacter sp. ZODW24]
MNADPALVARVVTAFEKQYGTAPARIFAAPGRVNLIGEHTDYNDGFVMPCALGFATIVAAGPNGGDTVEVLACDLNGATDSFGSSGIEQLEQGAWQNHVRGIASEIAKIGNAPSGINLAFGGDVPQGAGLSSSASLGVAVGAAMTGSARDPVSLAKIAHASENNFVGCACGIMDQLVSACGEAGAALLVDCRSLQTRPVSMPGEFKLLIIHSGVERGLVDSAYNERRQQCEAAAAHYGVTALRDLGGEALLAGRKDLDETTYRRALHVVTENARTLAFADALERADATEISALMAASHASMKEDFEVTVPPIDALVTMIADVLQAQGGVRMTGGGFGGCVVALVPNALEGAVLDRIGAEYRTPSGAPAQVWSCNASSGVGEITASA